MKCIGIASEYIKINADLKHDKNKIRILKWNR